MMNKTQRSLLLSRNPTALSFSLTQSPTNSCSPALAAQASTGRAPHPPSGGVSLQAAAPPAAHHSGGACRLGTAPCLCIAARDPSPLTARTTLAVTLRPHLAMGRADSGWQVGGPSSVDQASAVVDLSGDIDEGLFLVPACPFVLNKTDMLRVYLSLRQTHFYLESGCMHWSVFYKQTRVGYS